MWDKRESSSTINYRVSRINDITQKIIPYFNQYPLLGYKALDFSNFCKVAELVKNKAHLTGEGLQKIRDIKTDMVNYREMFESNHRNLSTVINSKWKGSEENSLYMYNRDKTILYHSTNDVKEFSEYFKIHKSTLSKHITNGTYYLGKYHFTRELSNKVLKFKNLSLHELNLMLSKDREKFRRKV